MNESLHPFIKDLLYDLLQSDILFFWLLVVLTVLVIVLDALSAIAEKKQKASGFQPDISLILTPSANFKETREYVSEIQGLAGKPDALVVERGYVIPVERKSSGNKIRDRHIAQLLVHMRLIEEFEGKRPPYGYLILGKNSRRVKIINSDQKQQWLQKVIDEMRDITDGKKIEVASPHKRKCSKCVVREYCDAKI